MENPPFIIQAIEKKIGQAQVKPDVFIVTNKIEDIKSKIVTKQKVIISVVNGVHRAKADLQANLKGSESLAYDYHDVDVLTEDLNILAKHYNIEIVTKALLKGIRTGNPLPLLYQGDSMAILVTFYPYETFE